MNLKYMIREGIARRERAMCGTLNLHKKPKRTRANRLLMTAVERSLHPYKRDPLTWTSLQ